VGDRDGGRLQVRDVTTEQMRQWLYDLPDYSPVWREKVKKMPDAQVIAIYRRLQKKGEKDQKWT
jgi:hypothetical protein